MKEVTYTVAENTPLTTDVYRMRLTGDTAAITAPGQFLELRLPGFFLRRPLSICDWDGSGVTLLYKVVGGGTDWLRRCAAGQPIDALTGLGNGFDTAACGPITALAGGGIGIAPLYGLARRLLAAEKTPVAVLGYRSAAEMFWQEEFRALGIQVIVATEDGSCGVQGFVTDALPEDASYFYACGPEPMLRAVWDKTDIDGQLSFESRMGCGFGACMGCSCQTKYGAKRICRDGPVLTKGEILW